VNGTYVDMVTVIKTSDDNTTQAFEMPSGTSGTVYVRVIDTDRTEGNSTHDTLYIDQMYFHSLIGGPVMTNVPNVTGLAQVTAEENIVSASLVVGNVTTQNDGAVPAGDVISQNPAGGASVAEGSSVDLVVSLGAVATGYQFWAGDPGGTFLGTLTDPSVDADFDGGGLSTGIEWVLGGDPTDGSDDAGRAPAFHNNDPDNFTFTFRRRDVAHADPDTTIQVQYATGLNGWNDAIHGGNGVNIDDATVPEDGFHTVVVSIPKTLAGPDGKLFARLKVATSP